MSRNNTPFAKRNSFNLTNERLLTLDMGQLIPAKTVEVMPGDTFTVDDVFFSRLDSMISPALVNVDLLYYHHFVPFRILMENDEWEAFITGGKNGDGKLKDKLITAPYMMSPDGGYTAGSLADYLEMPIGVSNMKVSAFPFRAYAKIYNDWFRDENLIDEVALSTSDGLDETTNTTLLNKCWEKDYFTSALPWPQRGEAASIPLLGTAPVLTQSGANSVVAGSDPLRWSNTATGDVMTNTNTIGNSASGTYMTTATQGGTVTIAPANLVTDLSSSNPVTINEMRVAFQVQRFLEKQARGGSRLVETVMNHFGVRIPDGRLQRSEYLGGGRMRFMISPVEQTSATSETSPQGNLAGRGTLNAGGKRRTFSFVEHGFFMTLIAVVPRTLYSQGLPRMYSRESRYDYYWPVFAHLGEQEIRNKEIYAQGTDDDNGIFGYQDRGAEYRHIPSSVAGLFRPGESMEFWHLGRSFDSLPQLNGDFVTAKPSKRIFAVQDQKYPAIVMQYHQGLKSFRPLPKYGTPGLIDHG